MASASVSTKANLDHGSADGPVQDALGSSSKRVTTTTTTTTAAATTAMGQPNGDHHKVTVLRETIQAASHQCKSQIGLSGSKVSQVSPTVDRFFDAVAIERLRYMPCDGSRVDVTLRWASRLAFAVDALRGAALGFAADVEEASTLIWGCCILLLQSEIDNIDALASVFARYGQVTLGISMLLQYKEVFNESIQLQHKVIAVFANLLELISQVTVEYMEGTKSKKPKQSIESHLDAAFSIHFKRFSTHWTRIVEFATVEMRKKRGQSGASTVDIGSVRQFLEWHDRPLHMLLDMPRHSVVEGSFEWFEGPLADFTGAERNVLLVTGAPGCGKSALAQWTVDRLLVSAEHDKWNVIPYTIRADIPAATTTSRVLKGLLLRILDHCISHWQIQEEVLSIVAGAADFAARSAADAKVDEQLWKAVGSALASNEGFMLVIDGLDHLQGGEPAALSFFKHLQNAISKKKNPSKIVAFSRPLPIKVQSGNVQQLEIHESQVQGDLAIAIQELVAAHVQLQGIGADQQKPIVDTLVNRAQGSFIWGEMAFAYAKRKLTAAEIVSSIQGLPSSLTELMDYHLRDMHLDHMETRCILAWLAAAERPLLVNEVEELLHVEPKAPSFRVRGVDRENYAFSSLSPLVVIRDGVMSFRHPVIRDYVTGRAQAVQDNTNTGDFPFNLKEAHYDLVTKCLAWAKLSLSEEVEVNFDKLSLEERNRLFDNYSLLEYTATYWLSHLLSSPLQGPRGEFHFTPVVQRSFPDTVLFARLEFTCRESQFTEPNMVESYRLAADIRRSLLGNKSKALLQSLIMSAQAAQKTQAGHANDTCYQAWKLSQQLLEPSSSITSSCAQLLMQAYTMISAGKPDQISHREEEVLNSLVMTDWDSSVFSYSQVLVYLEILIQYYQSHKKMDSALAVFKQFYQRVVRKYGASAPETTQAAEFLTGHFKPSPEDSVVIDVVRKRFENLVYTTEVTDEHRINLTFQMAQLYEQQQESQHAESVLCSLWAGLSCHEMDSVSTFDQKAKVALVYYRLLHRRCKLDEATVVIRELISDLQNVGIHSQATLHRAEALLKESKDLQLNDLKMSISVLIWTYYKESGQQYSKDSISLALSLVETMRDAIPTQLASNISGQDQYLLRELLDTIASKNEHLSVSLLIMCRTVTRLYAKEEDWLGASATSWSVLKHAWPSVEDPTSTQTFASDVAPHMADLALELAHCYYRRYHLETANVIYSNVFKALIKSEQISVSSVLAVVNTIVEYYESTFQLPKAADLLQQTSKFLESRLGVSDEQTIDILYAEGNMAIRLEKREEATRLYQKIYAATRNGKQIAPKGLQAALALIGLYKQQSQQHAALDTYRSLWLTLIHNLNREGGYDRSVLEGLLVETYKNYMAEKVKLSERYEVSLQYQEACSKVYGPNHEMTMKATLLLAEACEEDDAHLDEAISLYEQILQNHEWVTASQTSLPLVQMSQSLPITLKHKIAHLYVRTGSTISKAVSIYREEFELAKQQQGYFASATLSWLREFALGHSRTKSSDASRRASEVLHTYVMDVLHASAALERLTEWAQSLAKIYLEAGYVEAGNGLIEQLRHQVVYGQQSTQKEGEDRGISLFIASFEEAFGKRTSSATILQQIAAEEQLYRIFATNLSRHDLIATLAAGERLLQFQLEHRHTHAAKDCRERLYDYFSTTLSGSRVTRTEMLQQLFQICLREVLSDDYNLNILLTTTDLVRDLCNASRFQEAAVLVSALHSFVHQTEGLRSPETILASIKACLYLNGYETSKCHDKKISQDMHIESKLLLQEAMAAARTINMQITELPFSQLNSIVILLGEYEYFEDLEAILTELWTSRTIQGTWSADTVVWIGRRLIETRFCRGKLDAAIQLCRDICYNLRQVWGSCDPVTLEITKLLSVLYTESGNHSAAINLHETVLHDLLDDPVVVSQNRAADTALQHIELFKSAKSRLCSKDKKDRAGEGQVSNDLLRRVSEKFGLKLKDHTEPKGVNENGVWHQPRRFSLDVEIHEDHHNHLRDFSGSALPNGNGNGYSHSRRISIQAL